MSEASERSGEEEAPAKKTKDVSAPRKKKRKKQAKVRKGVPLFAQRYPQDEELDALLVAFERGNYALVREGIRKLISSSKEPAVKQAAEDLAKRLEPDPLARFMLFAASLLLVFFTIWYFTHRLAP